MDSTLQQTGVDAYVTVTDPTTKEVKQYPVVRAFGRYGEKACVFVTDENAVTEIQNALYPSALVGEDTPTNATENLAPQVPVAKPEVDTSRPPTTPPVQITGDIIPMSLVDKGRKNNNTSS
ncbi:MAG: hypothetical protein ACO1SV_06820 [Fimbriimonas sp.]